MGMKTSGLYLVTLKFFMHTGVQRKKVSRADGRPAQRVGEETFPTRFVFKDYLIISLVESIQKQEKGVKECI